MDPRKDFKKLEEESIDTKNPVDSFGQKDRINGDDESDTFPPYSYEPTDIQEKSFWVFRWLKKPSVKNSIVVLILIFLNVLYLISNKGCPYMDQEPKVCVAYLRKIYPVWLVETAIIAACWVFILVLAIHKAISRCWIIVCIINAIWIWNYRSGTEWQDHGGLNRFSFTILSIIMLSVYSTVRWFTKLYRWSIVAFVSAFLLVFAVFIVFYETQVVGSCGNWDEGLAGHKIDNDGNQCKIPIPSVWELGIRSRWLDFSTFTPTCDKTKTFSKFWLLIRVFINQLLYLDFSFFECPRKLTSQIFSNFKIACSSERS